VRPEKQRIETAKASVKIDNFGKKKMRKLFEH